MSFLKYVPENCSHAVYLWSVSTFPLVLSVLARKWALDYTVHAHTPCLVYLKLLGEDGGLRAARNGKPKDIKHKKNKKDGRGTCILFLDRIVCDSSSRLTCNSVVSFAFYFSALEGGRGVLLMGVSGNMIIFLSLLFRLLCCLTCYLSTLDPPSHPPLFFSLLPALLALPFALVWWRAARHRKEDATIGSH